MGGDFAPEAVVKGAVMALDAIDAESRIVLFGDKGRIEECLAAENCPADRFSIVHTTSAGSTGAMMVGSMYVAKPVKGVIRPTISTTIPTVAGTQALMMDVGLNVDCKPEVLSQYGLIGSIYAESVLGIRNPRVALLNIGEEEAKGNAQTQAAYQIMKAEAEKGRYNFVGNVESSHLFSGKIADVIICDGFVGNIALKMAEGLYVINHKMGTMNPFWEAMNYENVGGTPVLGVNAAVMIGHGKSTPKAIKSMILSMERSIRTRVIEKIRDAFKDSDPETAEA